MIRGFSGSYDPDDVCFLLRPVEMAPTDVAEKERLIQSGEKHYSEILAPEHPPSAEYLALFDAAFERNADRLAADIASLALRLAADHPEGLVLASLARAGTPIGVLLRRALRRLQITAPHYSISIIRDRGIDAVALDRIRAAHPELPIRFVDGWTGKGAIARELERALGLYYDRTSVQLRADLVAVADLAGVATLAASGDDYLIPSAILNAVVSGLVSRTVLNATHVSDGQLHACVHYTDMARWDRSRWFVDTVDARVAALLPTSAPARWSDADRRARRDTTEHFMTQVMAEPSLSDRNRIKPGVGEATRAVLRRMPDRVFVRDRAAADVQHLVHLAGERGVPAIERPELPYAAVTIIRRLGTRHAAWT